MIPASSDLTIYQGDSFSVLFRVRASVFNAETQTYSPGDYVDLTGATAKSQIRATAASATVVEEFTPTIGAQSGDTLGAVNLTLTPAETAAIAPGTAYVWDVQITYADDSVSTYLAGKVTVIAEVTRDDG